MKMIRNIVLGILLNVSLVVSLSFKATEKRGNELDSTIVGEYGGLVVNEDCNTFVINGSVVQCEIIKDSISENYNYVFRDTVLCQGMNKKLPLYGKILSVSDSTVLMKIDIENSSSEIIEVNKLKISKFNWLSKETRRFLTGYMAIMVAMIVTEVMLVVYLVQKI
jgi:hypothetical protein